MKVEMLEKGQWISTIWKGFSEIIDHLDSVDNATYFTFDNLDYMVCNFQDQQIFYRRIEERKVPEKQYRVETFKPFWANDHWSNNSSPRTLSELNNTERFIYIYPGLYYNKNNNMIYKASELVEVK